jgi:endonuclease/exonuclease/phosphatase family metal-dependent hydrolase
MEGKPMDGKTVKRFIASLVVAGVLLGGWFPGGAGADDARLVTVMTQNVYHGVDAELNQAAAATSLEALFVAAAAVFNGYHARNYPERAAALAAEIEATRPDVIGLQEAVLVRTDTPTDGPATPAIVVSLDYVQILLNTLAARNLRYAAAVTSINWDIEVPTALGFDLRHTDRIAILVRTDVETSRLRVLSAQRGHFATNCTLPTAALGPVTILRGWTAIDVKIRGQVVRLINTHLDGDCPDPAIQVAQANEILHGPANTGRPVVLFGDLNSKADGTGTPTYSHLLAAGFGDAWHEAEHGPGLTCCQEDDLLNPTSILSDRRDFVLVRGRF